MLIINRVEKDRLNRQAEQKYWLRRFSTGIKAILNDWRKAASWGSYLIILLLLIYFRNDLFSTNNQDLFKGIENILIQLMIPVYGVGGFFFLIVNFGTPIGGKTIRDNLWRIGLTNHAGEAPLLIAKRKDLKDKRVQILEFETNGIPLKEWENKRPKVESALDVHVVKISEGMSKRRIIIHTLPVKSGLPDIVHWKTEYISKENFVLVLGEGLLGRETVNLATIPHILLGGSTGSEKSVLLKSLIMQCIMKNAVVCIADFKGGVDFPSVWHRDCRIVIEENELFDLLTVIVEELMRRRLIFKELECANIIEYNEKNDDDLPRFIFVCAEVAEILDKTGLEKSRKELVLSIESKLSTIARLGRAFGIHLILATQRPDATILSGQIRNNVNYRVCGRSDNVLSQIILDNTSASEQIPKDAQGRFINHDGTVFQGYWFDENKMFG